MSDQTQQKPASKASIKLIKACISNDAIAIKEALDELVTDSINHQLELAAQQTELFN